MRYTQSWHRKAKKHARQKGKMPMLAGPPRRSEYSIKVRRLIASRDVNVVVSTDGGKTYQRVVGTA